MLGLEPGDRRHRRARAHEAAEARGSARRHVHHHQPRAVRRPVRHADHQPAAGGDSRRRHDREAAGRDRRCDRHPDDGLPDARLRSPADRRRRRRPVHGRHQAPARALRREPGCEIPNPSQASVDRVPAAPRPCVDQVRASASSATASSGAAARAGRGAARRSRPRPAAAPPASRRHHARRQGRRRPLPHPRQPGAAGGSSASRSRKRAAAAT